MTNFNTFQVSATDLLDFYLCNTFTKETQIRYSRTQGLLKVLATDKFVVNTTLVIDERPEISQTYIFNKKNKSKALQGLSNNQFFDQDKQVTIL